MLLVQRIDKEYKGSVYLFYVGNTTLDKCLEGDYSPITRDRFNLHLTRCCILKSLE